MSSVDIRLEILSAPDDQQTRLVNMAENTTFMTRGYEHLGNVSSINDSRTILERPAMEYPLYLILYFTIVNCLVFLVGVVGNIMVIQVIARMKAMRTRMNYFLMSLSIADLLVLVVCQPTAMLEFYGKDRWLIGEAMCKVVPFLEHASLHSSGLTLLTIGFERYLAICHPLKEQRGHILASSCTVITTIWVVSYIVSLPFVFITFIEEADHLDGNVVQVCRTKSDTIWQKTYIMFIFVVLFALPLCLLVIIYSAIISKLCKINSSNFPGDHTNTKTIQSRKQVVRMLIALMLLFFLCLLPMRVVIVLVVFAPPSSLEAMGFEAYLNLLSCVRILMYINSAGNPIIYGLLSTKFRVAFRRSVPHCRETVYTQNSINSSKRTCKNTCMIPMNNYHVANGSGTAI